MNSNSQACLTIGRAGYVTTMTMETHDQARFSSAGERILRFETIANRKPTKTQRRAMAESRGWSMSISSTPSGLTWWSSCRSELTNLPQAGPSSW